MENGFKPCPFCGGTSLRIDSADLYNKLVEMHGRAAIEVRCRNCDASMFAYQWAEDPGTYPEWLARLRDKWNRRAGDNDKCI